MRVTIVVEAVDKSRQYPSGLPTAGRRWMFFQPVQLTGHVERRHGRAGFGPYIVSVQVKAPTDECFGLSDPWVPFSSLVNPDGSRMEAEGRAIVMEWLEAQQERVAGEIEADIY